MIHIPGTASYDGATAPPFCSGAGRADSGIYPGGSASGGTLLEQATANKETADASEFDWNALYSGVPTGDEMQSLARKGPGDCREALLLKDELNKNLKKIEMQVTSINNAIAHYGAGTHPIGRTMELSLLKTDGGKTQMIVSKKDGSYSETTVFDPGNPEELTFAKVDANGTFTIRRQGNIIEVRETNGEEISFQSLNGRLLSRKGKKEDFTEQYVNEDGSLKVRHVTTSPLGKTANETALISADENRKLWHSFVQQNAHVLNDPGNESELPEDQKEIVLGALSRYPGAICRSFQNEDVKILVVNRQKQPRGGYPGMSGWPLDATGKSPAAGYYDSTHKIIVVAGDALDQDLIVHEAAHTLDDIQAPDGVSFWGFGGTKVREKSSTDRKLKKLYAEHKKRSGDNGSEWSPYGLCNLKEYYAEGVKFYLGTEGQKEMLKSLDPGMYEYIAENLRELS